MDLCNEPEDGGEFDEDWTKPSGDHNPTQPIASSDIDAHAVHSRQAVDGPGAVHRRVIVHIDIDCFYAQVEMLRNPALKDKPLGIQQKYIIVTCNYVAREFGVTKLMLIKDAKEKCPSLVLVSGEDLTHYREMSYKISEFLLKYCPKVERLGFDENFLDITELVENRLSHQLCDNSEVTVAGHVYQPVTEEECCSCGCRLRLSVGSQVAAEVREALFRELGITCCVGIAHNKLLSKLVAGCHKPNQQTTLFPQHTGTLMSQLKGVRSIPGIGHTTAQRLRALNIVSISDLQMADIATLEREFGKTTAHTMSQLCVGVDDSPVMPYGLPQTLSDEDSFKKCSTEQEAIRKIRDLTLSLLSRLKDDGRTPQTLRLTVRKISAANKYPNRESRQCHIPSSFKLLQDNMEDSCTQLEQLAMTLFHKMVDVKQLFHLTLINVAFTKLEKVKNSITKFFSPQRLNLDGKAQSSTDRGKLRTSDTDNSYGGTTRLGAGVRSPDSQRTSGGRSQSHSNTSESGLLKWFCKSPSKLCVTSDIHKTTVVGSSDKGNASVTEGSCVSPSSSFSTTSGNCLKRKSSGFFSSVQKRSKEHHTTSGPNAPDQCNIPDHIDRSVFDQLPVDIQQEILGQQTLTTGSCVPVTHLQHEEEIEEKDVNNSSNPISRGLTSGSSARCTTQTSGQNLSCGNENTHSVMNASTTEIVHGEHNRETSLVTSSSVVVEKSASASKTVSPSLTQPKLSNSLCEGTDSHIPPGPVSASQSRVTVSEFQGPSSGKQPDGCILETKLEIPPGVDPSVFHSLPRDIQSELVSRWKSESAKMVAKFPKQRKPQPGIKDFFGKPNK